ncbi:MAG: ABC transporter substrate-binding protein [Rhodospirillales bacterium]|nr:MAG: ABC transporter substrate-binding protein [Rhodospirillales bacterium]
MRMFLGALAALFLLPAAAEAAKDSLVLGMPLEPPHLDPTAGAAAAIDEVVYANVFEGLTRIDETGAVQKALAEDWTISEDGLTYTFKLRDGVTFHDGTTLDSGDVKFSLDRARAAGSTNAQKGLFEAIESVEAPDPLTVIVKLARREGLLLWNLGWGDAVIVAPETAATNKTKPVGTGPFRFVEWKKADRVRLARRDDYWGEPPALATVTFRFVADPSAQVAALLAGDIDAIPNVGAPESLERFKVDDRFEVRVGSTEGETILAMNHRREPLKDVRVRRAISHAIDRKALIDGAMFGYGTPIGTHFAPHHAAYKDLTKVYRHDAERARALLAEAGYPVGFKAVMKLPPPSYARRGGEIIAAQLAAIGITVEIVPVEWAQWLNEVFKGDHDFDFTIVSHTEPLDIGIYARDDYYFGYQSDAFNAVIGKLKGETNQGTRNALYGEAQRIIAEDAVNGFLFQLARTGVQRKGLKGLWLNAPVQANDVTKVNWEE